MTYDEEIILEATEAYEKNLSAGCYVGDLLRIIKSQKATIERQCEAIQQGYVLANEQKTEIERLHIEGLQINKTFMDFVNKQIAKAIKEFADKCHADIHQALESNYKAKNEALSKYGKDDGFVGFLDGKILALRGIDDFIDTTLKELTESK